MHQSIITTSAQETRVFGKKMAEEILPGTCVCLSGDLGAGKTTFSQGFLEGLGASRPFVSPTFVIMKQYDLAVPSKSGIKRVYHADAYRVEEKDFVEIGFQEWCDDKEGIVILEWSERVATLLSEKRIEVMIKSLSEYEREIKVTIL